MRQPIDSEMLSSQKRIKIIGKEIIVKLLYIHNFVTAITNSAELAYQSDEAKKINSRWLAQVYRRYQKVLGYSSFMRTHLVPNLGRYGIRDHIEQSTVLPVHLNEITQVFFSVYADIGIEASLRDADFPGTMVKLFKKVDYVVYGAEGSWSIYETKSRVEVLNDLISGIRKQLNKPDPNYQGKPIGVGTAKSRPTIKDTYKRRREKIQKRFRETKEYVRGLLDRFSEVQIVNIDLGYAHQRQEMSELKTRVTPVPIEVAYSNLRKLRNNERRNALFGDMVGYVWCYDVNAFGVQEFHCLFFFKALGSRSVDDLADRVGKYWNSTITNGRGSYITYEKLQRPDKSLGFNLIWKNDLEKWQRLVRHLCYITCKELYLRVGNIPRGTHLVGHSRR